MSKPKQHNSHVRARARLIARVLNRRYDWGGGFRFKGYTPEELRASIAASLAVYKWSKDWDVRQLGRYHSYGGYDGPKVLYKDVPTHVLHGIMCSMKTKEEREAINA